MLLSGRGRLLLEFLELLGDIDVKLLFIIVIHNLALIAILLKFLLMLVKQIGGILLLLKLLLLHELLLLHVLHHLVINLQTLQHCSGICLAWHLILRIFFLVVTKRLRIAICYN
jgi:hypothetical protein